VVERDLAKVDVAGSTPVSRSSFSQAQIFFYAQQGGSMRSQPASLPVVSLSMILLTTVLLACGSSHSLQSVTVSPATAASSKAQFTATGIYNSSPTSVDITASTTWCIGSSNGVCDGNIAQGATVSAGLAQCLTGFSGTVTVLAGKAASMGLPDQGQQLKPYGAAQLTCP
jgi:hypothetical protein